MQEQKEQQLPEGWKVEIVSSIGKVITGNTPPTKLSDNYGGNIPFIKPPQLQNGILDLAETYLTEQGALHSRLLPAESVLVSCIGNLGRVGISKEKVAFNQQINAVIPNCDVLPKFIFYQFQSSRFRHQLEDNASATTISIVNKSAFEKLTVFMAPMEQQKQIVEKIEELFSELDSGVTSLKTAQQQLKLYRQSLLKHAFEGKLTEQWRKDNADKLETPEQLLARIQTEREARYQQQLEEWQQAIKDWEAQGKEGKKPSKPTKSVKAQLINDSKIEASLPWIYVNYESVCELIRNGISAKPVGDSGTKILRISSVRAMKLDLDDFRYIYNENGQYDDFFLKKGDLVFTRYNGTREYVGVCAEYKGDESHLYPDKLILTRLGVQSILPSFIEKAFSTGLSRTFIEEKIRTTAGQSGISGGDIKSAPIPVCSLAEQQEVVNQLEEKFSVIEKNEQEIESALAKAELLRQSILKKAFSGSLIS